MAKMHFRSDHAKKEWNQILTPEYISSDESGLEEDNDVLVVHQLPWRARAVSDVLKQLDNRIGVKRLLWHGDKQGGELFLACPLIGQSQLPVLIGQQFH